MRYRIRKDIKNYDDWVKWGHATGINIENLGDGHECLNGSFVEINFSLFDIHTVEPLLPPNKELSDYL